MPLKSLSILEAANSAAVGRIPEFRRRSSVQGTQVRKLFHEFVRESPYFGYIPVQLRGISPFWMFSNNDDLIAQYFFWFGDSSYETMTLEIWLHLARTARVICDIGAFTGLFALAARKANKEADIHCVEPLKGTFERLLINLRVNRYFTTIKAHNIALADTAGDIEFNYFRPLGTLQAGASLVPKESKRVFARERVAMDVGDDFFRSQNIRPELLKIDVEEAELTVLRGMRNCLTVDRPNIVCEVSPRTFADVHKFLSSVDYEIRTVDDRRLRTELGPVVI
jgi:FkbM family methyltransferase